MPIIGAKYRMMTAKNGDKVRLAFVHGKVVEAKNMRTGEMHTPAEFAKDRAKKRIQKRKGKKA